MKIRQSILAASVFVSLILIGCDAGLNQETGKVVRIKDGDTIVLLEDGNKEVNVRLAHIDAPEKGQPFGNQSKQALSDLCFNEVVTLRITDKPDRYGREIGEIILPDGTIANKKMVELGMAWHFTVYSDDLSYKWLEMKARKNKTGLWSDPSSVPPWEYRKEQKNQDR